ncbi:SMI1/KNR4 family protein [Nocardia sp. MH4]|uniref:SMI1/KNR4 family protein n=1 Tax=Nocardia sp. MH4 TaxID=1768677 RepID=UPI001C4EAB20|nr:SMI1/KNR4 family protein [Nocardia sp. MH4]
MTERNVEDGTTVLQWQTIELSEAALYIEPAEYEWPPMIDSAAAGSLLGITRDFKGNENAQIWVGWTHGFIQVGIGSSPVEPGMSQLDEWETVEEGAIELGASAMLTRTTLSHIRPPELDQLLPLPSGLHRVRVSARGRARNRNDVAIAIQLWPTTQRTPLTQIKHTDAFDVDEYARRLSNRSRHPDPDSVLTTTLAAADSPTIRPPVSATVANSINAQWARLRDTIVAGSPDTWVQLVRPAAQPRAVVDAEQRTGVEWPAELREWFFLHDGGGAAELLPSMTLLGLDHMIDIHAMQCEIWADLAAEDPDLGNGRTSPDAYAQAPASSEAGQFIPQFIPIAERDGTMLICDTRSGPLQGCITEFGKDTADDYPPTWASLSAMLADLTNSIASGAPFQAQYQPELDHTGLHWTLPAV